MFNAREAVKRGMADRVATMETILKELGGGDRRRNAGPGGSPSASASVFNHRQRLAFLQSQKADLLNLALKQPGGRADSPDRLPVVIEGIACPFGRDSNQAADGRFCRIAPGAFTASLADGGNVEAVWQHSGPMYGQTCDGTLRVWEDSGCLRYELHPPKSIEGRRLELLVRSGRVRGVSIRYQVEKASAITSNGNHVEVVERATLLHIGLTDCPAMPGTSVGIRDRTATMGEGG